MPNRAQMLKFSCAIRQAQKVLPSYMPGLFVLTDPVRTPDCVFLADQLPRGCGLIYRHFGAPDRKAVAVRLKHIARRKRLTLLIGNDPALARSIEADGVHWPEAAVHKARYWRKYFPIMTGAAHSRAAIQYGKSVGLDALLLSSVFPSKSPSAPPSTIGASRFRDQARCAGIPLYGLGGVKAQNAGRIAGVAGLASIEGAIDAFC